MDFVYEAVVHGVCKLNVSNQIVPVAQLGQVHVLFSSLHHCHAIVVDCVYWDHRPFSFVQ